MVHLIRPGLTADMTDALVLQHHEAVELLLLAP